MFLLLYLITNKSTIYYNVVTYIDASPPFIMPHMSYFAEIYQPSSIYYVYSSLYTYTWEI